MIYRVICCSAFLLLTNFVLAQDEENSQSQSTSSAEVKQLLVNLGVSEEQNKKNEELREERNIKFSNLLNEEKLAFRNHLRIGHRYASNPEATATIGSALEHYLAANALFEENFELQAALAGIYVKLSDYNRAIEQYISLQKHDPLNGLHYYNLGECYFVEGRFSESIEMFKKIRLFPKAIKERLASAVSFKIQLCLLGMAKEAEGDEKEVLLSEYAREKKAALSDQYKILYFYTKLLDSYNKDDEEWIRFWREKLAYVFPKDSDHAVYVDALIEYGFISSFYGEKAEKVAEATLNE